MPISSFSPLDGTLGLPIFASQQWTPSDVGRTVVISPGDENFAPFSNSLTDGVRDSLNFGVYPGPAVNRSGVVFFEPTVVWGNDQDPRIDLHGGVVNSYTLRLDSLSITNDPVTGRSTFNATATFAAYGDPPVPEPVSTALLLLCVGIYRRTRHRVSLI